MNHTLDRYIKEKGCDGLRIEYESDFVNFQSPEDTNFLCKCVPDNTISARCLTSKMYFKGRVTGKDGEILGCIEVKGDESLYTAVMLAATESCEYDFIKHDGDSKHAHEARQIRGLCFDHMLKKLKRIPIFTYNPSSVNTVTTSQDVGFLVISDEKLSEMRQSNASLDRYMDDFYGDESNDDDDPVIREIVNSLLKREDSEIKSIIQVPASSIISSSEHEYHHMTVYPNIVNRALTECNSKIEDWFKRSTVDYLVSKYKDHFDEDDTIHVITSFGQGAALSNGVHGQERVHFSLYLLEAITLLSIPPLYTNVCKSYLTHLAKRTMDKFGHNEKDIPHLNVIFKNITNAVKDGKVHVITQSDDEIIQVKREEDDDDDEDDVE